MLNTVKTTATKNNNPKNNKKNENLNDINSKSNTKNSKSTSLNTLLLKDRFFMSVVNNEISRVKKGVYLVHPEVLVSHRRRG